MKNIIDNFVTKSVIVPVVVSLLTLFFTHRFSNLLSQKDKLKELMNQADIDLKQNRYDEAIATYYQIIYNIDFEKSSKTSRHVHHNIGLAYYLKWAVMKRKEENLLDEAIRSFQQELNFCKENSYEMGEAYRCLGLSQLHLSSISNFRINSAEARKNLGIALKIAESKNYPIWLSKIYSHMGSYYYKDCQRSNSTLSLDKAIEQYSKALDCYRNDDTIRKYCKDYGAVLHNIGNCYMSYAQLMFSDEYIKRSEEHFNSAIKTFSIGKYTFEISETQISLGDLYSIKAQGKDTNLINIAIQKYEKAIKLDKDSINFDQICCNIGNCYLEKYPIAIDSNKTECLNSSIIFYSKALNKQPIYSYDFGITCLDLTDAYIQLSKLVRNNYIYKNKANEYLDFAKDTFSKEDEREIEDIHHLEKELSHL